MQRLGVGIVGLGLAVKPHALALRELGERIGFLGGYSPTAERRRAFERDYDLPTVDTLGALLNDDRVDILLVLTPLRRQSATRDARAYQAKPRATRCGALPCSRHAGDMAAAGT